MDVAHILGGGQSKKNAFSPPRKRKIHSPYGVGEETVYAAQKDLQSINCYNMWQGKLLRVLFFHSCIPRPSLVLSTLLSLGHHIPLSCYF